MAFETYKDITLEDMMKYIDEKAPDFKADFKKAAMRTNKNGITRYNSAAAKHAFCKKFMPDLLPPKKEKKPNKTKLLENW